MCQSNVSLIMFRYLAIGLTAIFLVPAGQGFGQIKLGVKASYSLPFNRYQEIKYDDWQDFLIYKVGFREQDVSPSFGLFSYYNNGLLYFQGEVNYRNIKSRFTKQSFILDEIIDQNETKSTHYITIPVSAGLIFDNFKAGVGPIFSFIVKENPIFQDLLYFEERREEIEAGFTFSFGLMISNIHIDLIYEYHFAGVGEYFYFREDNWGFKDQPKFLTLSLGVGF